MTTFRWYMLGLALLFGAYVAVEYYRPKPLDWSPTLRNDHKIPYGTYVLYDQLPAVLGTTSQQIQTIRVPIYSQIEGVEEDAPAEQRPEPTEETSADSVDVSEFETDQPAADSTAAPGSGVLLATDSVGVFRQEAGPPSLAAADTAGLGEADEDAEDADYAAGLEDGDFAPATYLFVARTFELSRLDCRSLLRHVARGNDVFVAAEDFNSHFADTLGFSTRPVFPRFFTDQNGKQKLLPDSVELRLSNPALARQAGAGFRLPAQAVTARLLARPALADGAVALATDERGRPVLLRIPHGRGHVYICTVPLAFANYFVLQPRTTNFAFAALSYLPTARPVWWDEYQKQGRRGEQSLMRVLLEHEALRYATYLAMAAALLFVAFKARRRQRVIPVLKPLPNTTLLFTRTVAGLYRQNGDHALIAEKKIGLFLEHLRTRYHEPTLDLSDEATRERLAQKSGVARAEVDALIRRINFLLTARQISDGELMDLNKTINTFRQTAA
ncbi:DUF4350 domain-containing protein [Hymenobacter metallilatus]|uniref:DUF4350 domain-containing protein n=1 Tax=Hymenobacter metallilatus TaxID=2493666 RepID=A0A428IYX3_9BACT|nr:DUF4350 domain-containing protein [Hymenobacter metallilatus]RSK24333.1 hypothetical protein EI290_20205 [Hymenobacter metallilatus]